MSPQAYGAAFVVCVMLLAGVADVILLAADKPTISRVLRQWGDGDPLLSLSGFLLLWHLFVQR
jgi:hypothetical protein